LKTLNSSDIEFAKDLTSPKEMSESLKTELAKSAQFVLFSEIWKLIVEFNPALNPEMIASKLEMWKCFDFYNLEQNDFYKALAG